MEDVGKTKTCGVQGVVICSPDIKTENENSQVDRFRRTITSKISFPPTKIEETAPKKNIREFPMKKATTVVMAPAFPSFAKRAKFGVAVPPETKEPMTRPAPPMIVSDPLDFAN